MMEAESRSTVASAVVMTRCWVDGDDEGERGCEEMRRSWGGGDAEELRDLDLLGDQLLLIPSSQILQSPCYGFIAAMDSVTSFR
ncbi:hypothetical protein E3N88_07864 [Mikania micrantha]|uniref:Uncharacterized protein n=1 Tax=Mikania micrantha TaxID=192012 RepID=A0A5N6PEM0_9ASTR|nr:hypothetical protein E3N88_07864 [Mikania micrantha]